MKFLIIFIKISLNEMNEDIKYLYTDTKNIKSKILYFEINKNLRFLLIVIHFK